MSVFEPKPLSKNFSVPNLIQNFRLKTFLLGKKRGGEFMPKEKEYKNGTIGERIVELIEEMCIRDSMRFPYSKICNSGNYRFISNRFFLSKFKRIMVSLTLKFR